MKGSNSDMLRKVNRVTHPRPLTRHELIIISNQNKRSVNAITKTAQATPATVTSRHAINTNGKTQPTERITRQKLIAHYKGHYDRFFTRDDVQKWEHEFTRTAQFKAYTAYTKPHSYLDEFIPF